MRVGHLRGIVTNDLESVSIELTKQVNTLTEPMERKNPKVAALLSMYWDSVGRIPRGPAPPLYAFRQRLRTGVLFGIVPEDSIASKDEAYCETDTNTGEASHSGHKLH